MSSRVIYIFTDHCIEELGDHYDGCAEGPPGFDFTTLQLQYWDIQRRRRYKYDGLTWTSLTIGDIDNGYEIPPHPGYFGDFVIANNPDFTLPGNVKVIE